MRYTKNQLDKEIKIATKNIKRANKGLAFPVKINRDYELLFNDQNNILSLIISYLDGNVQYQTYHIAL